MTQAQFNAMPMLLSRWQVKSTGLTEDDIRAFTASGQLKPVRLETWRKREKKRRRGKCATSGKRHPKHKYAKAELARILGLNA